MAYPLSTLATDRLYAGGSPTFDERGPAVADDWFASQGAPAGPAAPAGRMSNAQAQQFFDQLFPGGTVTPEQLEAQRPQLQAARFQANPKASRRHNALDP